MGSGAESANLPRCGASWLRLAGWLATFLRASFVLVFTSLPTLTVVLQAHLSPCRDLFCTFYLDLFNCGSSLANLPSRDITNTRLATASSCGCRLMAL